MAETITDGNTMMEDTMVEDTEAPSPPPPPAAVSKNGRKAEGNSIFSWIFVLALLGAWTAVGVVWFDIVDYDTVVGTLVPYDIDGDGHLGLEDAKVLLDKKKTINVAIPKKEKTVRLKASPDNVVGTPGLKKEKKSKLKEDIAVESKEVVDPEDENLSLQAVETKERLNKKSWT
ncbi:hypothetical protein AALO_G00212810 [Alosa alosa]|uniref:Aspartyl beta-hydroxylase/Triadin domain-containing protein n=1 Tax=Alosa alosa TaxID=278164 RepID=A0AAV6G033_9TELE|nr:hypothetical protein AALO_G00212810 [Alosa alosa]